MNFYTVSNWQFCSIWHSHTYRNVLRGLKYVETHPRQRDHHNRGATPFPNWRLRVGSARLERNYVSCELDRLIKFNTWGMHFHSFAWHHGWGAFQRFVGVFFVWHSTRVTAIFEHAQSVHATEYSNIADMKWKFNPRPMAWCRNRIQELNGSEDTCTKSRRLTETYDFCVTRPYRGKSCTWLKRLHEQTISPAMPPSLL